MKKLLVVLAMAFCASIQAQAGAPAAPVWGCKLVGNIDGTISQMELILIRGEEVVGHGTVVCRDLTGRKVAQNVNIHIVSGGVGPAFNQPLEGLRIYAARAGVTNLDGMIGQYQLGVGPRLGLIEHRVGLLGGAQVSGYNVGAGIEAVIENRFSVGIDLGGMELTVSPARHRR